MYRLRKKLLFTFIVSVSFISLQCSDKNEFTGNRIEGFIQSNGASIHYIVDYPEGEGPFPAIVYGNGSGNITANFRLTLEHAVELIDLGFAVMRYDKRGLGQSTGELEHMGVSNSNRLVPIFAQDMAALVDQLAGLPKIRTQNIGLFGISQAGWFMPLVPETTDKVSFIVSLTGGGIEVGVNSIYENLTILDSKTPEEASDILIAILEEGYTGELGFVPFQSIRDVEVPMLYLFGEQDPLIPFRVVKQNLENLISEGNDISIILYSEGVHGLRGTDFWPDLDSRLGI